MAKDKVDIFQADVNVLSLISKVLGVDLLVLDDVTLQKLKSAKDDPSNAEIVKVFNSFCTKVANKYINLAMM